KPEQTPPVPEAVPASWPAANIIDRTAKLYVGGKQTRPDSGYSYAVSGSKGPVGLAALGNRKDIRSAVEAAHKAAGWGAQTGHNGAQVLYYFAEYLAARSDDFQDRLASFGQSAAAAQAEVDTAIRRIVWYASQADKFDGLVHS